MTGRSHINRSVRLLFVLVVFSTVAAVTASQSTSQLRGSWRATVGTRVFQGTWTAVLDPKTPNLAHGSWTVIEANRVLYQGTWAAEKERAGWRGGWSALVAPARPGAPPMTGTWQANIKDSTLETLTDMLKRTAEGQVDGTWRSGRMAGSWSLVR